MDVLKDLLSSEVMQELVRAVPFAAFSIIVLIMVNHSYHKNLKIMKDQSEDAMDRVEKAYDKSFTGLKELVAGSAFNGQH